MQGPESEGWCAFFVGAQGLHNVKPEGFVFSNGSSAAGEGQ